MRCHNCGQEVPEGTRFCGFCGQKLVADGRPREPSPAFNEDAPTTLEAPPRLPEPSRGGSIPLATQPPIGPVAGGGSVYPPQAPRSRRGWWIAGIGALVVVAIVVCVAGVLVLRPGDLLGQLGLRGPSAPPATSAPFVPPTSSSASIAFTVENQAASTICFVRISPTDNPEWGDDWLRSDIIPAGASHGFDLPPGEYDLRAEFCDGGEPEIVWAVDLTADRLWVVTGGGGVAATQIGGGQQPPGGDVTLTVYNQGSTTVCFMRISPTTESTWGDDWLGSSVIGAGGTFP